MRQVGYADSKITLDVYAQLEHRVEQWHAETLDGVVRRAAATLVVAGAGITSPVPRSGRLTRTKPAGHRR
jgi:hypothetical protein